MGVFQRFLAISIVALVVFSGCSTASQPSAPASPAKESAPAAKEAPPTKESTPVAKEASPAKQSTPAAKEATAKPSALEPMDPPLNPPVKVRYGSLGNVGESAVIIAREKGYFKEQGLDVEMVTFKSPVEELPALATNRLDVGSGAITVGLYNAIDRGVQIKIVADKGIFRPGHGYTRWVVRKDLLDSGQFKGPADLKGKKVAISDKTTATYMMLDQLLEKNGLTIKDVDVTEMGFPDMIPALTNKAIDVAALIEPFATTAIQKGIVGPWTTSADLFPNLENSTLNYSPEFAKTEAAKRFMVAYLKGVRDYNNAYDNNINRKEIIDLLAKNLPPNDPALWEKMVPMGWAWNGYLNMDSVQKVRDWFYANGLISQKTDISSYVDYSFLDYALKKLGKYDETTGKPLN